MPDTTQAPMADPLLRFSNAYVGHVHSHNPDLLRAGLLPSDRMATIAWITSLWGFGIGAYMGGRKAGLQYFAEHMHKLPKTHQGWYFYHKHKNYRVMLEGIKRGLTYAARFTAVSGAFTVTETALDLWKGDTDFTSTLFAAFTTAYGFATLSKSPEIVTTFDQYQMYMPPFELLRYNKHILPNSPARLLFGERPRLLI
ncbi:hypothetical protein H4R34_002232 [Dimargaris verticillata]|uniref:Tim17/Tim22/Tim23/Pmp24 family-domain-containing protein n=1 Tax=Dimargaris verticillata TaxID=2761393 RepID=A0A9W8B259_9FUNG|nr:hypothetical protein H4R34_002232 [Dimargaris verticillata]